MRIDQVAVQMWTLREHASEDLDATLWRLSDIGYKQVELAPVPRLPGTPRVVVRGWTVFGDRKIDLAAVPRVAGTPRIVVHARTVFGDLKLRSLAPGESASRWRQVMDRLAGGQPSRSNGTAE